MKISKLVEVLKTLDQDETIGVTGMYDEDCFLKDGFNIIKRRDDLKWMCGVPYSNKRFEQCDYYIDPYGHEDINEFCEKCYIDER